MPFLFLSIFVIRKKLVHGLIATRTTDTFTADDLLSAKAKLTNIAFTYSDSNKELEVRYGTVSYTRLVACYMLYII